MKKLLIVAATVALAAAACGDAAEDAAGNAAGLAETEAAVSTTAPSDDSDTTATPNSGSSSTTAEPPILDEGDLEPDQEKTVDPANQNDPVEEEVAEPVSHPDPNVAVAMTDLVGRSGVAAGDINLVSVEEVTWSDGSLGCPLPGMRYTQALVNGTRIVLEVDGTIYQYHSGPTRAPFYCANPSDPVSGDYGDQ